MSVVSATFARPDLRDEADYVDGWIDAQSQPSQPSDVEWTDRLEDRAARAEALAQRTRERAEFEHKAHHDSLTLLPNRALLVERVRPALRANPGAR